MATSPPAAPAPVRLRLVFDNRRLLRRAQRNEGLRRCWLLLRPELATIADLAAHVVARFRLRCSCPRGVVLSMGGFALPPFESTCIFRDNDIIRVKQKSCKMMIGHNDAQCIQVPDIVEKRPLPIDGEILAIEYRDDGSKNQEKEKQSDDQPEENANVKSNGTSSKRKWCDGVAGLPESSKKTKLKVTNSRKDIDCSKENNDNQYQDHQSGSKKLMLSAIDIEAKKTMVQSETTATSEEQQKLERQFLRNHQTELTCEVKAVDCNAQSNMKKLESRSARRKKLKRQLRRKTKEKMEKNVHENPPIDADYPSSSNQNGFPGPSSNQNGSHVPLSSQEEESDTSDEVVPVVVRPGHIRFEPAGEPDKSPAKEIQGTFQWSGTISKKMGQKWGMNNLNKKNADIGYHARIAGSNIDVSHHVMGTKATEDRFCGISNQNVDGRSKMESSRVKTTADEEMSSGEALDFESLYPLTRFPKEGDLIAYRLIELSSSLCPELSSYRVGKVLVYDPISLRIILLPVPECPIISEENKPEDESDMLVDFSPYKEDGSLEIEYSSLLDVRLLKGNESVPVAISTPIAEAGKNESVAGNPVTLDRNRCSVDSQEPPIFPNDTKTPGATPGKTKNTVWEENGEPPNDKPDVQENGWGTWTRNASTSAWSYRALRSSALGPTMAILRGKNSQQASNQKYGK